MNAPKTKKEKSWNELLEDVGGFLVLLGLIAEVIIAIAFPSKEPWYERWSLVIANGIIAIGVYLEIHFGGIVRAQANARAEEAIQKAEEARLERVKLESQLAARTLTKDQFDILQKLKGKLPAVVIASDAEAEPIWFATVIAAALHKAGIEVTMRERAPHAHSTSNFVCDKRAFHNPDGEPTRGEPLVSIFNEAGIPVPGLLAGYPGDLTVPGHNDDIPMVVISGRFVIPPKPPYLGEDAIPPPPTMVERMRNP